MSNSTGRVADKSEDAIFIDSVGTVKGLRPFTLRVNRISVGMVRNATAILLPSPSSSIAKRHTKLSGRPIPDSSNGPPTPRIYR